ncbi:MAG: DUF2723 domain-containing protein [Anaerolineaceae bacterium]|nr:DUF2723 domain-containing protein [Anaerolineaceae bacterium]MCB9101093.1 DUF2723 domain-containing protein [Anaerolineales bacterium]
MSNRLLNWGLVVLVMITALFVYIQTLAPSITWQHGGADSGDLAAAVATLGVAHPPGYPTYVLAGYAWSHLPLGGDLAYRLNLFSAAGAALAAGLTALIVMDLAHSPLGRRNDAAQPGGSNTWPAVIGAVVAGLFLAFAPLTWSQATITEVYAPGLAALCLFNWLMLKWHLSPTKLGLTAAGLVAGLGFGLLPQIVLVGPGLALLLIAGRGLSGRFRQQMGWFLLGAALGLSVFLYLPLRAADHPFINWGDPSTPASFWAVVTAAQYHHYFGLLGPADWLPRLFDSVNNLQQGLSWSGLALAGLGGYVLWGRNRSVLVYLLSLTGLTLIFRVVYPAIGNVVYLLPALACLTVLIGLGATWLLEKVNSQIGPAGMAVVGASILVTLGIRVNLLRPQFDLSDDHEAAQFGQTTLAELPPQAVILSGQDETTFSLWYQQALGRRPDVVVVDTRLLQFDWYQHHLRNRYSDLTFTTGVSPILKADRLIFELTGESERHLSQLTAE